MRSFADPLPSAIDPDKDRLSASASTARLPIRTRIAVACRV